MFVQPFLIRMRAGVFLLQLLVGDDAALLGVHQKHSARLQTAFDRDALRRDRQHAGFRRHDDHVVFRDVIARRAQAVAVQARADADAVRERHRGRAVPRFDEAGMKFVKRAALGVHALVIFPRLGNHHHHRVRQFAARHDEQFHAIVKLRRVAAVGVDDGNDFLDVLAEHRRFEIGLRAFIQLTLPRSVLISPLCAM